MILTLCSKFYRRGTIVFFDKKQQAHRMYILMQLLDINCGELHGNLSQQQRLEAYDKFGCGDMHVLLATDLAGRGLDIKGVKTVINFEMPRDLTVYVHRVGRTARAGRSGHAVTLTGEGRRTLMKEIVKHAAGSVKSRVIAPEDIDKWCASFPLCCVWTVVSVIFVDLVCCLPTAGERKLRSWNQRFVSVTGKRGWSEKPVWRTWKQAKHQI